MASVFPVPLCGRPSALVEVNADGHWYVDRDLLPAVGAMGIRDLHRRLFLSIRDEDEIYPSAIGRTQIHSVFAWLPDVRVSGCAWVVDKDIRSLVAATVGVVRAPWSWANMGIMQICPLPDTVDPCCPLVASYAAVGWDQQAGQGIVTRVHAGEWPVMPDLQTDWPRPKVTETLCVLGTLISPHCHPLLLWGTKDGQPMAWEHWDHWASFEDISSLARRWQHPDRFGLFRKLVSAGGLPVEIPCGVMRWVRVVEHRGGISEATKDGYLVDLKATLADFRGLLLPSPALEL